MMSWSGTLRGVLIHANLNRVREIKALVPFQYTDWYSIFTRCHTLLNFIGDSIPWFTLFQTARSSCSPYLSVV